MVEIINEVFPNPTVKQIIFQIKFPNLLYLENKIGDYQSEIIRYFPESAVLFKQDLELMVPPAVLSPATQQPFLRLNPSKIWEFKYKDKYTLHIQTDGLDISTRHHETYNNPQGKEKFRDIITISVDPFLKITKVPTINRIGLRYTDEGPLPNKDNATITEYYNTTFPIDRFDLSTADGLTFAANVARGDYKLNYRETLTKRGEDYYMTFDFDGYAENIDPEKYIEVTDVLHKIIQAEYFNTIKEPVIDFMKREREDN